VEGKLQHSLNCKRVADSATRMDQGCCLLRAPVREAGHSDLSKRITGMVDRGRKLTVWTTVLSEKLIVQQLIKKFPTCFI
jgi:hypothetical protein